jgi:hypothetical protein
MAFGSLGRHGGWIMWEGRDRMGWFIGSRNEILLSADASVRSKSKNQTFGRKPTTNTQPFVKNQNQKPKNS